MQKYDSISFRKLVLKGTTGYADFIVPDYGTVEQIDFYFAAGQALALQLWPVIIQSGSKIPNPLLLAADDTDAFVTGDDLAITRKITRPVTPGDIIRINYKNTDAANDLHMVVDVSIDYYAGKSRVV